MISSIPTRLSQLIGALLAAMLIWVAIPPAPAEAATSLEPGDRGSAVSQLQRELSAKGFYRGSIDGVYTPKVSHAVMAFRKEIGASRAWTWHSSLWSVLRNYKAPWTPLRPGESDRLEINLTRQVMYLFQKGELKGIFPVASGNGELFRSSSGSLIRAFTPTGNFRIQRHIRGWRTSYLGRLFNPWYFTGGYAVHGSNSVPAYPASHGCVRVTMWDSSWLESRLYIGMPVHVWKEPRGVGPKIGVEYVPDRPSVAPIPNRYVGDYDADGLDDGAAYAESSGTWWVAPYGRSSSIWTEFYTRTGWDRHLVGDFNRDGRDDIANYHPATGNWVVSRSTGSSFDNRVWTTFTTKTGWDQHLVGDFNGDGRDDIANYHPATGNWVVSRSTGSSFDNRVWTTFTTKTGWDQHLVGDFNRDGRDDIANYHPATGNWVVSLSTGSSFDNRVWTTFTTKTGWDQHLVGDFNGDGRDDIAMYHPSNGKWWVSRSTGSSFDNRVWTTFTTKTGWDMAFAADLNDSGWDDIAIHHSSGSWWALMSTRSGFLNVRWTTNPPK